MLPYCNRTVTYSVSGKIFVQVCPRISLIPHNGTRLQIITNKITMIKSINMQPILIAYILLLNKSYLLLICDKNI